MISSITTGLALLAIFLGWRRVYGSKNGKLPPSPPADPIIGHARIIPLEYSWKTFAQWRKTYGDLIYVHVLGRPMLVVNSVTAARDLMDKGGSIHSDRPHLYVFGDLMGWSSSLPFLPYGNIWRKHRRLMQDYFSPQAAVNYVPMQVVQVQKFLRRMLAKPEELIDNIHTLVGNTVLLATYGREVNSVDDPYSNLVRQITKMTTESGTPGATIIDLFPMLRHLPTWLPGMGLKRHALKTRVLVEEFMDMPFREAKASRAANLNVGPSYPSMLTDLLDKYESGSLASEVSEEDIKTTCAVIYSSGVETTESTIGTFFFMMVLNRDIVKQAQQEIDRVVGFDRLPTLHDRGSLPFIDCIMREVFRFNPAVPLCIPHQASKTDEYLGYTIAAGTMILPNIWHMMRDEEYFDEPNLFKPSRYLSNRGPSMDKGILSEISDFSGKGVDPADLVFGFGRRECPGRFFVDATLWLTISNFLAVFDIRPPVDPRTGEELVPEMEFTSGTTSAPKPFKFTIAPRSEMHAQFVRDNVAP